MRSRRSRLGIAVCLALVWAGCRSSLPPDQAWIAPEAGLFDGLETRDQLSDHLGGPPSVCVGLLPDGEACEWRVDPGDVQYRELGRQLGVSDRIGVICALPAAGGPREPGSCSLHQRRSNRHRVTPSSLTKPGQSRSDLIEGIRAREQGRIDGARSLLAMSRALGQLPERCAPAGDQTGCEWRLSNRSYGHGTVAYLVRAGAHQKVRWACRFPSDGTPRALDSCSGQGL